MRKIKKYTYILCLLLAGLLVALVLAEVIVRAFYPYSRDHVIPGGIFEMDDHLGWRLRAGGESTHRSQYFEADYSINSLGFRDRTRDPSIDTGKRRILLYGDSLVFGWGVDVEKRFSNRMESLRDDLEVWNLAVPGYGLDQEVISYLINGKRLRGEEVFLFLSHATLIRSRLGRMYKKAKPKFELNPEGELDLVEIPEGSHRAQDLLYRLLSPFYLPYFLEKRLHTLKKGNGKTKSFDTIEALDRAILLLARDTALENGQKLTILAHLKWMKREDLEFFCRENGIGFVEIDLGESDQGLILGEEDRHWNANAYKLITEQIMSQME